MFSIAEAGNTAAQHCPFEYIVQIYAADGRLLSECFVDAWKHKIADIKGAELYARSLPAIARFGTTVVIVSSEVADSIDQVHVKVADNDAEYN